MSTVSAVIVCFDEDPEDLRTAVANLQAQTRPPDEIVLVDNGDGSLSAQIEGVRALRPGANLGYPPAINYASTHAESDFLFCLNPDAGTDQHCLERLLAAAEADERIAVVGAQILLPDGMKNGGDNPLHPLGISIAGDWGKPRDEGASRDVIGVAGTCCLMRRRTFVELGGFVDAFFLYYDDADYCWRANIAGHRVVYEPTALMTHAPEWARRGRKWFYLERNRLFSVLSNYETRTLARMLPLLVLGELGIVGLAVVQRWLPQKLAAYRGLFALRGELAAHRRRVQSLRRRSDHELWPLFESHLDSPFIPKAATHLADRVTDSYLRLL